MQLISLKIYDGARLIRKIRFKNGLNIITNATGSGNRLGKSTSLRALKFCLGSKPESLWKDPDNGQVAGKVKTFVTKGTVRFDLKFIINSTPHSISRALYLQDKGTTQVVKSKNLINGKIIKSSTNFQAELAALFGYHRKSPSFASIRNKFFRIDKKTCNNAIKYLSVFTKDSDYALIYSYLFGFDGINIVQQINLLDDQINAESERLKVLLDGSDVSAIEEQLEEIDSDISDLERREDAYDVIDSQNLAISKLRDSRRSVAIISERIAMLETKIFYHNKTIDRYRNNLVAVEVEAITKLYNEAKSLIPNLSKTLEDTVEFHNSMMVRKAEYIEEMRETVTQELDDLKSSLERLLLEEKRAVKDISRDGHFSGFILLEKQIQERRENRGRISFVIEEAEKSQRHIKDLSESKEILRRDAALRFTAFTEKLSIFNKIFKSFTKKVLDDGHNELVATEDKDLILKFSISNEQSNTGDGVPRAVAMAFDMAYVKLINKSRSKLISFTAQDYLEAVDEDKLKELFEIANSHGIQTIVSILRDKLYGFDDEFKEENIVLELSDSKKFFKLS